MRIPDFLRVATQGRWASSGVGLQCSYSSWGIRLRVTTYTLE